MDDRMDKGQKRYLSTSSAARHFGVSPNTIRSWDSKGFIKTIRVSGSLCGHRRYDIQSFAGTFVKQSNDNNESTKQISNNPTIINEPAIKPIKKGIIYARVSSRHQKDDLERQIKQLSDNYPNYEIIKDIGSGINFKRIGFLKLIERTINRDFEEIVVAHRDRLSRFGFDFLKWLVFQFGVSLVVLNDTTNQSSEQELAEDILSIIHVFSCRQNGRRKYKQASNGNNSTNTDEINDEEISDDDIAKPINSTRKEKQKKEKK
jgi:predicted site-specific integrase-resolvase